MRRCHYEQSTAWAEIETLNFCCMCNKLLHALSIFHVPNNNLPAVNSTNERLTVTAEKEMPNLFILGLSFESNESGAYRPRLFFNCSRSTPSSNRLGTGIRRVA